MRSASDQNGINLNRPAFSNLRTFSASMQVSPVASATDIAALWGVAGTIIGITRVTVTAVQNTTGTPEVFVIKRSTANTGSTPAAATAAPHDAGRGAAAAAPVSYTGTNPTLGTGITMRREHVVSAVATSGLAMPRDFLFTGLPVVLRGVAQGLCINLNGVAVPAGQVWDVSWEWFETVDPV